MENVLYSRIVQTKSPLLCCRILVVASTMHGGLYSPDNDSKTKPFVITTNNMPYLLNIYTTLSYLITPVFALISRRYEPQ